MENNYIQVARQIVISYFDSLMNMDSLNIDGFQELMSIKLDKTNKVLLEHIKAMKNIMEKAIEQIESKVD